MTLDGVLFLAAYTDRSRAYAQAMAASGLGPERVLLFGDPALDGGDRPAVEAPPGTVEFFLPDLGVTLQETCSGAGWRIDRSPADDVNADDISRHLAALFPRLVIYSGYGGQLVGRPVLDLGIDFLHIHAGWLPTYRGSTTVYYSWLTEGRCGASALLLDDIIDGGPIVARRHYPPPPPGIDVDCLYDSAMRADLLVDVLRAFAADGRLPRIVDAGEGTIYYVIHPVLKHLVLASRERAA